MTLAIQDFLNVVETCLPLLPESESPPVLQLGSSQKRVRRALVVRRLSAGAARQAAQGRCDLVLALQPLVVHGAGASPRIDEETARLAAALLQAGCALACVADRLESSDLAPDRLAAEAIGLGETRVVPDFETAASEESKFVVFVPEGHESAIVEAVARGGGGVIGRYSHCTFRSPGIGTYRPLEGANPWAGEVGRLESAPETRLEARVPRARLRDVFLEVRRAHPYEEMAYDAYPLEEIRESERRLGLSGELERPVRIGALANRLRRFLENEGAARGAKALARHGKKQGDLARKIAICLGEDAARRIGDMPADHDVLVLPLAAAREGLGEATGIVQVDRGALERVAMKRLARRLLEDKRLRDAKTSVRLSSA